VSWESPLGNSIFEGEMECKMSFTFKRIQEIWCEF
jgi:hypothetical protein